MTADRNPIRGCGKLLQELSGRDAESLQVFVGRTIVEVWKGLGGGDDGDVAFTLDDGTTVYADPEGDCCSRSWVEHVSGVKFAYGAEIVGVDLRPELATQEDVDDGAYECLALYGITLITAKGERIDIDYRNDSNGYYGGWLNWAASKRAPDPKHWKRAAGEDW